MKFRTLILAAFLMLWSTPAFSQGCAMCYGSAAAATKDGQKAIGKGVMVLLIPPLGFMTVGVWMAFRYGRKRDLEESPSPELADLREISESSDDLYTAVHSAAGGALQSEPTPLRQACDLSAGTDTA